MVNVFCVIDLMKGILKKYSSDQVKNNVLVPGQNKKVAVLL